MNKVHLKNLKNHVTKYAFLALLLFDCCMNPLPNMNSESILLSELQNGDFSVTVKYKLKGKIYKPLEISFPEPFEYTLKNFIRTWNQENLEVIKIIAPKNQSFYNQNQAYFAKHTSILPITFNEYSTLIDTYTFSPKDYTPLSKEFGSKGRYIEYILVTGALWSDIIEKIDFNLELKNPNCSEVQIMSDSYFGYCTTEWNWSTQLLKIKPNKNIRLIIK